MLREIHEWKTRTPGPIGKAVSKVNKGIHHVTSLPLRIPGVKWTIDHFVAGVLRILNELAQDTVARQNIFAEYRKRGFEVYSTRDIRNLTLRAADTTIQGVNTKYRSVTGVQGVAAGAAGLAGIAPDVLGLVAFNLRAAGEYGTYFGFDMSDESERLFALQILDAQVQVPGTFTAREEDVSQSLAATHTQQTVQQVAVSASVKGVARTLGQRLTAIKLAQVVPVAGAMIGGTTNALYTQRVCTAALHLYRERRLLEKYPRTVLEQFGHA